MATDKELTAYEFLHLWTTECRKHLRCHWCEGGESKLCPFYYLGCGWADSETIPTPAERSSKFNKDLVQKIKELRDSTNTAAKPEEDRDGR